MSNFTNDVKKRIILIKFIFNETQFFYNRGTPLQWSFL